ncbi:alpha/beta hydrolase [Sphingobacterium phlebotomi]|uniref:Alpha/beta hydrolase n=1 Tax=Sphingobacterium phlebotomi TaxID=2605433 RepID=A0A5D4GYV0_9SPHI|nr:alpha/beta hydrolase [Sphingobacterium phlebotomi]TYR33364.1 alpha/beta hydrolase [Sphingobacterium phlebotomi]
MRYFVLFFMLLGFGYIGYAQEIQYETIENISYVDKTVSDYATEQCKLDIHYPTSGENKPIVLWFHGGGLTGGKKEVPAFLKEKGLVVVGVGYRFAPNVKVEDIIRDAAKATSFIVKNAGKYRGDTSNIFISGHSAGGYLALMITLNKTYLEAEGFDADKLAGIIPFSAQTITHFTARKELGIDEKQPTIDELAPLFWVRKDAPPIVLLTGDRELELLGRYEENAYLKRMLSIVGHKNNKLVEFQGYDHGMVYPGLPVLLREIQHLVKERQ